MTAVTLSPREQALANKVKADRVRRANAELRRELTAMTRVDALWAAAAVLEDPTAEQGALPVHRLLKMVPRFREDKKRKMLARAEIQTWDRRIRELSPRQRTALAVQLQDFADGYWRA